MLILLTASVSCLLGFFLASWSYKLEHKDLIDSISYVYSYHLNDLLFLAGVKYIKIKDGHINLFDMNDNLIDDKLGNILHRITTEYYKIK